MTDLRRNVMFRAAEALVLIATTLLQFAVLTRHLSIADVGSFVLNQTWLFLLTSFSFSFGILSAGTREVTQGADERIVVSNAVRVQALMAVLVGVPFLVCVWQLDYFASLRGPLLVSSIIMLVSLVPRVGQLILGSHSRMREIALIGVWGQLAATIGVVAAVQTGLSLFWIMVAPAVSYIVSGYLSLRWSALVRTYDRSTLSGSVSRHLLSEAVPMAVMAIVCFLYVRIDTVMLEYFAGRESVGIYSASYCFLDYLMILSNGMMSALFPNFTATITKDPESFRRLYRGIMKTFVLALFPVAALIAIFAPAILTFCYGSEYAAATQSVRYLMAAAIFAWLNGPSGTIFIALKKQSLYMWGSIASLGVNVVGNLILIPAIGIDGAAVATALTEIALCVYSLVLIRRYTGYLPFLTKVEHSGG